MRKVAFFLAVGLLSGLLVGPARAQGTTVSGVISSDTTWTEAESPYRLEGTVMVAEGVTLTIEPAVEVEGSEGAALVVRGDIDARGTEADPIRFGPVGTDDSWGGVHIGYRGTSSDRSALHFATVAGASTGLTIDSYVPSIDSLTLDGNSTGLHLKNPNGYLLIENSVFTNNAIAVKGRTREVVQLRHNDFWNNSVNLLPAPQSPFDCGSDDGAWLVTQNDILRGPVNESFWSYDVHTPAGSRNSSYTVDATDNWWGTTEDVDGRLTLQFPCCPPPYTKEIPWEPVSRGPHTAWTPPGPVPEPEREGTGHADPGTITTVSHPEHSSCMDHEDFKRVRGITTPALAPVDEIHVEVKRFGGRCRGCDGRVIKTDDGWIYKLGGPVLAGRYEVTAYGRYEPLSPGRNVIRFRLLR